MLELRYWCLVLGGMLAGLGLLSIQTWIGLLLLIFGMGMLVMGTVFWRNRPF